MSLWRGELCADVDLGMIGLAARARFNELRLTTLELQVVTKMATGQEVVTELRQHALRFPFHERIAEYLMVALYRAGRQSEAIGIYHETRQRLSMDLGVSPTPRLHATMVDMLRHAPHLLTPA